MCRAEARATRATQSTCSRAKQTNFYVSRVMKVMQLAVRNMPGNCNWHGGPGNAGEPNGRLLSCSFFMLIAKLKHDLSSSTHHAAPHLDTGDVDTTGRVPDRSLAEEGSVTRQLNNERRLFNTERGMGL
jgi:hypothetical protein